MVEYLVVVWLTFMDGSVSPYKEDQKWDVVSAETSKEAWTKCVQAVAKAEGEMREAFNGHNPKPSTFMSGCVEQENQNE